MFESADNTLVLTSTATTTIRRVASATSDIDLTQQATNNLYKRSVTSALALSDGVFTQRVLPEPIIDALFLTQSVDVTSSIRRSIESVLTLVDSAKSSIKVLSANSSLNLTQSVAAKEPKIAFAVSNILHPLEVDLTGIDLSDPVAVEAAFAGKGLRYAVTLKKVLNLSILHNLALAQQIAPTHALIVQQHLHLSDVAWTGAFEAIKHVLQLRQAVSGVITNPVSNVLNLTQSLIGHGVIGRAVTSTLDLDNIVTFYRLGDMCNYDPGVGAGPSAPSMIDPIITPRSGIILTYPYVLPTLILQLRNPIFDDTEQLEFRRINRKTRGGTLKIFRYNIWPKAQRLIYSFEILKESEKQALLSFLQLTIGKEIGLLDFESRQWRGIILTPATLLNEERRSGSVMTIEFEGTVDSGGLQAAINVSARVVPDVKQMGPGIYANINVSAGLFADVIRD